MLIENLHLVGTLSLLILLATGWFTSLYPVNQTQRKYVLYLLISFLFLFMLPAVPITNKFFVHITLLILMIGCFALVYRLPAKNVLFVLGSSAILGAVFSFWNYMNQIHPSSFSTWVSWIQLGFAIFCAYFIGNSHIVRWSLLFHILLYTHFADSLRAIDRGEIIILGSSNFLSQVTLAFFCFVIIESFLSRFWFPPFTSSRS